MMIRSSFFGFFALCVFSVLAVVPAREAAAQQTPPTPAREVLSFAVDSATTAPLQLVKRAKLAAPPERVFGLLERYEDMPKWLGVLASVECDRTLANGTNGVGTKRVCKMKNGATIRESVVGYQKNRLIAYGASDENPMGLRDHLGVATTELTEDGGTLLTWRQYFNHPDATMMIGMMDSMMEPAFQKLVKGYGGGDFETSKGLSDINVNQTLVVDATPDDVWTVLGRDFGGVAKWASFVPHAELSKGADGATQRSCSTPMGDMKETVLQYDEAARQLAYRVDAGLPPIVAKAVNHWTVMPTGDGRSTVSMDLKIEMQDGVPTAVAEGVRANFSDVTRNFTEELAHYAKTGKPHPRKLAATRKSQ